MNYNFLQNMLNKSDGKKLFIEHAADYDMLSIMRYQWPLVDIIEECKLCVRIDMQ